MTKQHTRKPVTESNGRPEGSGRQTRQEAPGGTRLPLKGSRAGNYDNLTTGQVGRICQVAPRTVAAWFDDGRLTGYRLPATRAGGGCDRRIDKEALARFLLDTGQHGAYLRLTGHAAPLFHGPALFVGLEPGLAARLLPLVPLCASAPDLFSAGIAAVTYRPAVVVLDTALGRAECLSAARLLLSAPQPPRVLVLTSEDDGDEAGWLATGVAKVLRRPIDPNALAAALGAAPPT